MLRACLIFLVCGISLCDNAAPEFKDYPAARDAPASPAPLKLSSRSERMFRTQLASAASKPADFAGHYRFAIWGCGSDCAAGALVDLATGDVFQPPFSSPRGGWEHWIFCGGLGDKPYADYRIDSRLLILHCVRGDRPQDTDYFEFDGNRFLPILHIPGDRVHAR